MASTDGDHIGSGLPPVSPHGGDSHPESEEGPLTSMWQLCRLGGGLLIWSVSSERWMRRWSNWDLSETVLECGESVPTKSKNGRKLQWCNWSNDHRHM